jgi:hypothetical protein
VKISIGAYMLLVGYVAVLLALGMIVVSRFGCPFKR